MKRFDNLSKDIKNLMIDFLQGLRQKNIGNPNARLLSQAIEDAMALPNMPTQNFVMSFNYEDTWLYVTMTDYKIELCDSFNDNGESYTRFDFRYEIDGYKNEDGNLDEFRILLFNSLRDVSVKDISFSQEE